MKVYYNDTDCPNLLKLMTTTFENYHVDQKHFVITHHPCRQHYLVNPFVILKTKLVLLKWLICACHHTNQMNYI